jgi:hypothetical protein
LPICQRPCAASKSPIALRQQSRRLRFDQSCSTMNRRERKSCGISCDMA